MAVERIFPDWKDTYDIVDYLELTARYRFANGFVKNGSVGLDIACGAGYGTDILIRENNARFYGVDRSEEAICYAKDHYPDKRLEFVKADIEGTGFGPASFDIIVSFETIEHLEKEKGEVFLDILYDLLKPGGTLLISCPNKDTYPAVYDINPYHKYEYSYEEILRAIRRNFADIGIYCQKIRYFKRLPKKFAQMIKHLPRRISGAVTDIAKEKYLKGAPLEDISAILRIFLYERYFEHDLFPFIEDYGAYKPVDFTFVCRKRYG